MNLEELKNKSILVFGSSRAFSADEFESQIKFHNIILTKEYNQDVVLIVDGKMMTPDEQNISDKLYAEKKAPFVAIDSLDKELAKHIDADTLLMSLKLSKDKSRLKDFLTNSMIENNLFLRLLRIYDWNGEDFYDNNDNRDVSASIVLRFYNNIERNHNAQYTALGLMHLVAQTTDAKLLESIAYLEPIQKSLVQDTNEVNNKIISAIATNNITSKSVLNMMIKKSNSYIRTLIAMRNDCDEDMQKILFQSDDNDVLEALSYNANLSNYVLDKLILDEKYAKNIARYIYLNDDIFEILFEKYSDELAKNESITYDMQERLISSHSQIVMLSLARNEYLDEKVVMELLCEESLEVKLALYENSVTPKESLEEAYTNVLNHFSLANNENTPKHILKLLAESGDFKVLKSLAKNVNTPIDILYQFQLDARLERFVKQNPAFTKHIMNENIGWQS